MRAKIDRLEEALDGHFDDHHRFLLARMLGRIDAIVPPQAGGTPNRFRRGRRAGEAQLAPFGSAASLDDIPGIGSVVAAAVLAE